MLLPSLLNALIAALVVALVAKFVQAEQNQFIPPGLLRFGRRAQIGSLVFLAIALLIGYAALHARPSQRILAYSLSAMSIATALFLVLEFFLTEIWFDAHCIHIRSPWRKRRTVPWSAVSHYSFSVAWGAHLLHTTGFGIIRVDTFLLGFKPFQERLERVLNTPLANSDPEEDCEL